MIISIDLARLMRHVEFIYGAGEAGADNVNVKMIRGGVILAALGALAQGATNPGVDLAGDADALLEHFKCSRTETDFYRWRFEQMLAPRKENES